MQKKALTIKLKKMDTELKKRDFFLISENKERKNSKKENFLKIMIAIQTTVTVVHVDVVDWGGLWLLELELFTLEKLHLGLISKAH